MRLRQPNIWVSSVGLNRPRRPSHQTVNSPFRAAFRSIGSTPVGLAYFPLLGLGLASFVLNWRCWRWRYMLPWIGLAAISAFQARAIPFFAILGGPVLAWNLHGFLAAKSERIEGEPASRKHRVGDALIALSAIALLVCAWPGWLQAPPYEPRRWAIETAPSLERGAAAARRWREDGKLSPESRALHVSRDSAAAFAWFCAEEKGLHDQVMADGLGGEWGAAPGWADRMRAARGDHLIAYDAGVAQLLTA